MKFTIEEQGAPVPNVAHVIYQSPDCIGIELDMSSKYCELSASSGHSVFIGASEHSLRLKEGVDRDRLTVVKFDLPEGKWNLSVGSRNGRYTLTFYYMRDKEA